MSKGKYRLKGHESFTPREGWIAKGLEAVAENPQVFSARNYYGADDLGVGTNMAKSIRYWMNVMGLTKREKNGEVLTELGEVVYQYDPYIEEVFTMWLLHYHLCTDRERATSWYLFFNGEHSTEYDKEGLNQYLSMKLEELGVWNYSEKSLKDDVNAILAMYCGKRSIEKEDPEEKAVCPFSMLGLISSNGRYYIDTEPDREKLPIEVVLYVIYKLLVKQDLVKAQKNVYSLSIDTLLNGTGGVKSAFHLSNMVLNDILDQLENQGEIKVNRTAGLDVLYIEDTDELNAIEVAKKYYRN